MAFAKEMLEVQKRLQEMGHEVETPCDTQAHVEDPLLRDDFARNKLHVDEGDVMMKCFDLVAQSDAVLALNHAQKGIEGYLGASTLMEVGLAGYLRKKIFILNPIQPDQRYRHEINLLGGVIINGDLSAIH